MNINGEGKGGDDNEKNGGEEEGKWGAGGAEGGMPASTTCKLGKLITNQEKFCLSLAF